MWPKCASKSHDFIVENGRSSCAFTTSTCNTLNLQHTWPSSHPTQSSPLPLPFMAFSTSTSLHSRLLNLTILSSTLSPLCVRYIYISCIGPISESRNRLAYIPFHILRRIVRGISDVFEVNNKMASTSIVVSPIAGGFAFRSSDVIGVSSMAVPHGRRPKVSRVTCMAKDVVTYVRRPQPDPTSEDLKTTPPSTGPASTRPAAAPKASTAFGDIFGFSGAAPETINGRLAMVGFVSALGVEAWTGNDLLSQLSNGGVTWFAVTATVLSAASLIPMLKGVSRESRSERVMSSNAETWNGRFAMLGLVALALTEYLKGGPLV